MVFFLLEGFALKKYYVRRRENKMKISIAYPPITSNKGVPLLAQNRQFQWFNSPTYIYPMIPAYAATLLKNAGHEVYWNDFIAEEKSYDDFVKFYNNTDLDMIVIETKTPVVKEHWRIIKELKDLKPDSFVVLVGDHVTALPEESMNNCPVDFILTGGNYDFLLLNLCSSLQNNGMQIKIDELEAGIYYREGNEIKNTGTFQLTHDLEELPLIDRKLTKWELYSERNGNYSKTPGTYTMVARDCWHHKCTFCSWTTLYPRYATRTPESLLDEVGELIEKYGVKEIMDDSGAFPIGEWLHSFCKGMIERGYNKKVIMDCNMRFGALSFEEYALMKKAGFRFVLFGLESANQGTLDRICKNEKVEEMIQSCRLAKKAGLSPHITIMFGYPWEDKEQIENTVKLGRKILQKGWAHTLQATIIVPYPGTALYKECQDNDWLLTNRYEDFDQRQLVMKTTVEPDTIKSAIQSVYRVAFSPEFLVRRIFAIRSIDDIKFFCRAGKQVIGHLIDFKR